MADPKDKGFKNLAVTPAVDDPGANKKQVDFPTGQPDIGTSVARSKEENITPVGETSTNDVALTTYILEDPDGGILGEQLLIKKFSGGVPVGEGVLVARPYIHRKVDTLQRDVILYNIEILDPNSTIRKLTPVEEGNTIISQFRIEEIYPPYSDNDLIFVTETNETGVPGVTLLDLNVSGRTWREIKIFTALVTAINADTLTVQLAEESTSSISTDITSFSTKSDGYNFSFQVAKSFKLRRTPFDATPAASDGITYVYSDNTTRVATKSPDSETQIVIPAYRIGEIIRIALVPDTGVTGTDYIDLNTAARAWAKDITV